jgi:ABC-type branched-subunit amino acid transport system substrate-binding protein
MTKSRLWAVLLALGLVAAACGSSDDGTAAGDGSSSTTAAAGGSATTGASTGSAAAGDDVPTEFKTDLGVTDTEIRIGYNSALTGIFAPSVAPIAESTNVFWEYINANGGIAGRKVVPVILDSAYEVPKHLENNERFIGNGADSVVMIGQSAGSPQTAATVKSLEAANMAAIPLTWYSGWADPKIGKNIFEVQITYCLESMNGITYMSEKFGKKVAVISFPGEYGQDGATGAKKAIEKLGLELVYDGEGLVDPAAGSDQTPVITSIVNAKPDFVWSSINPTKLSEIMGGAVAQGFTGMWSGNSPTYLYSLLGSELADALDKYYVHSTYFSLWNAIDSPGMTELVTEMRKLRPTAPVSDLYVLGFVNGYVVKTVLEQAARNGDMTRAGVLAAAAEVKVDMKGLAPNQSWKGTPNEYIVRESYLYDVDKSTYTPDGTVSDEDASTGMTLLKGPYESPIAKDYDFTGACFVAKG